MSKKSNSVIITITIVLTAFVAILVLLLNPKRGDDNLSAKVLSEAQSRQNSSIVTVSEPLETDPAVISEEDSQIEKIASNLLSNPNFIIMIQEKSSQVASSVFDEKLKEYDARVSVLERKYDDLASSLLGNETFINAVVAYVEDNTKDDGADESIYDERISELERKYDDLASSLLGNNAFINAILAYVEENSKDDSMAIYDERIMSLERKYDDLASSLLENETFVNAIVAYVEKSVIDSADAEALARAFINTEAFKEVLKEYIEKDDVSTVPLPVFKKVTSQYITRDEYESEREIERTREIERVLDYLGY